MDFGKSITYSKVIILLIFVFISTLGYNQENADYDLDSAKVFITTPDSEQTTVQDTIDQKRENSPLDIGQDRGLYIIADEGKLQMRILGSVRFSAFYDSKNLISKNRFSTFYIPTGDENIFIGNYYNSLGFSRIGYEVTRKTTKGDFFIRIESDFAGQNNDYRIRHAYGRFRNFLIGQTWSLLTNVSSLPSTVDPSGADGSINIRTPQIRYSRNISETIKGSIALEYSLPELISPDSINITFLQTVPNVTARINGKVKFAYLQMSVIIAPITGVNPDGKKNTSFGYGMSLSGTLEMNQTNHLLFQATYGNSIAHFLNPFRNTGQDMAYDPVTSEFSGLNVAGGFLSYGHKWPKDISSYLSFGVTSITNKSFQPGSNFDFSYSISGNAFWKIVQGLRIGLEFMYGERFNIDGSRGSAGRLWALFYYDF